MKKTKPLFGWALLLAAIAMTAVSLSLSTQGAIGAAPPAEGRADVIIIDDMAVLDKLELPGVRFKHDLHTAALAEQGKDCASCHEPNTNPATTANWIFKFKRSADSSYAEMKEIYHTGCISCHAQEADAGRKTGPQAAECRSCHVRKPEDSARQAMSMNKYLHATHIEADNIKPVSGSSDANCGACHHVFDPNAARSKTTWKEQQEDACRACHLAAPSPNPEDTSRTVPALQSAVHDACVSCHFEQAKRFGADKSGPYNCAGCHSAESQAKLAEKRPDEVKRLDRGQPDTAMLLPMPGKALKNEALKGSMSPVPFDHKLHEAALDNCGVCHHQKTQACSSCHSLEGNAKGNFVNLATAMHKGSANRSCTGCHAEQTRAASCAGCHNPMPKTKSQQSCAACHVTPVGVSQQEAVNGSLLQLDKEILNRMAAATIRERNQNKLVLNMQDVPEKVSIGVLANEYKAAELPHRKIVESLTKGMIDNKLAQSFHYKPLIMCQGCHHNSPASLTPPKCASCHSSGDSPGSDGRPSLKVAYHNQCMSCHSAMKIEKPANQDCAGCHAPADQKN